MAIYNSNPISNKDNTRLTNDKERVFRSNEELQTSIHFDNDQDSPIILRQLSGSRWYVDYFWQIKDINDSALTQDSNLTPSFQKYHRINDLLLFTQSSISQGEGTSLSGEAIVDGGFLPNKGDVFKAELAYGRIALFEVTEVTKNTYNLHNVYTISYKFDIMLDNNNKKWNDLQYKTIKTYYYNKDYINGVGSPIIESDSYVKRNDLKNIRKQLIDYYLTHFTNPSETSTILRIMNTSYGPVIDPYLEDFFFKIVNVDEHPKMLNISRIFVPDEGYTGRTIWDVILNKDTNLLPYIETQLGWFYPKSTRAYVASRAIRYMGVYAIRSKAGDPVNIDLSNDEYKDMPIKSDMFSYVFGSGFYNNNRQECCHLELSVLDYLDGKVINQSRLFHLINTYHSWSLQHKFYGIPILLVIIQDFLYNQREVI